MDFPDVPNVPGVPPLNFKAGVSAAISLLTGDSGFDASAQQWGIFLGGRPVVAADSVFSFEFRNESAISDFPIERGAFESYNKVAAPYEARIRFMAGSASQRESLIGTIDALCNDLNLYDAVTPERVYANINIVHYDFHRSAASGMGLLAVDVWVREVRMASPFGDAPTLMPSGASLVNGGMVQAITPSAAQLRSLPTFALANKLI